MQKMLLGNTEAYRQLSKVTKVNSDEAQVYAMMMERTGLSMEDLIKNVKVGSEEYEKWRKEAERFGLVINKDGIKAGSDLAESWTKVKQAMQGFWNQIGAVVAKRLKDWNETIIGIVTWATKWVQSHRPLIDMAMSLGEKLMYVGTVLVGIGTTLTTIGTFLGPLIGMITAATAAWLAWDTATGKFLSSSAGDVWNKYSDGIKNFLSTVMTYGQQIIDYVGKITDGIFNAIKAGNLELAVKIAWSGAKVAWIQGILEIDKLTGEKFSAIMKNLASGDFKKAGQAAFNELEILWIKMLDAVDPVITNILNTVSSFWAEMVNVFAISVQKIYSLLQDAAGKLAPLAAAVSSDLANPLMKFQGAAPISTSIDRGERTDKAKAANKARENELLDRQLAYTLKLMDLEEQRAKFAAEGNTASAERLQTEQESLKNQLAQAEAEAAAVKAESARSSAVKDRVAAEKAADEEKLKRDELPRYKSEVELGMMKRIKLALDPMKIMNPGKVLQA